MITQELKNQIVEYYQRRPVTIIAMQEKFGVCQPVISSIIKDAGVRIWPKALMFNPDLREDYFDCIDSEMKAYFLGLILTDGCIFHPGDGRSASVSLTLKTDDAYILDKLRTEVQTNTTVIYDKRGTATLAIRSNRLADGLAKYGVVTGKTYRNHLPELRQDLMRHMLRGMIDGDGSIASSVAKNGKHKHCITICGLPCLMSEVQDHLVARLGIRSRKLYNYNDTFGEVKWSRIEDMVKIGRYLYDDASFYMKRKYEKFLDFCTHYHI